MSVSCAWYVLRNAMPNKYWHDCNTQQCVVDHLTRSPGEYQCKITHHPQREHALCELCVSQKQKSQHSSSLFDLASSVHAACCWCYGLHLIAHIFYFNAHMLNKWCRVPGRKYAPKKKFIPNNKMLLITRVYKYSGGSRGGSMGYPPFEGLPSQ